LDNSLSYKKSVCPIHPYHPKSPNGIEKRIAKLT
jgi:hypothetical protein